VSFLKTYLNNFSQEKFNFSFSVLSVISLFVFTAFSIQLFSLKIVYVLFGLVFAILLSFNFYLMFSALLLIVFTPYFVGIHTSVIFSFFLILSLLINFKFKKDETFQNPIISPLMVYIFLASLSIYNAPKTIYTLLDYSNLLSLILLIIIVPVVFTERKKINQIFYVFIFAVLIHSFFVIFESLSTGGRSFGLLSVFYVDLAGLAILYSIIFFLYNHGFKKYVFGFSSIMILIGLILSQTRNAWLSTIVTFLFLLIFLFINNKKYRINRKVILTVITIFILISGSFFIIALKDLNIDVGKRLETKTQKVNLTDNPSSVGDNSLLSRMFIWHTAINAFSTEPLIGIGLYSFKYTSKEYYTIPKPFFKQFVEHRTPHVAYLEVLVETGIVGFIGFIVFLFSIHKQMIISTRYFMKEESIPQTLLLLVSLVYISFSMFMTEAWLYGQYLVWFGIIVGLIIANAKMLISETSSN
jgi:O-antigen ligase